jgi:hypothetical protein
MMQRMALVLLAAVATGGCGSTVTGPGGAFSATKDCSAYTGQVGSFCTITASNVADIPVGSRVVYAHAATATGLDSDIVLTPPGAPDRAIGHCALSFATGTGRCTFSGGSGRFAPFHASVAVSHLGGADWGWEGSYGN